MAQSNVNRISSNDSEWWRLVFLIVGLLFVLFSPSSRVVGAEHAAYWRSDFKTALQEAEEKRLPLLIHFYADWCMPCQRMEREVFSSSPVSELLQSRFVAVKVNSDQRQDLVNRYGVVTLPSDVVVDSLTGRTIALTAGFQKLDEYVNTASQAEARFKKAHAGDLVVAKSIDNGEKARTAVGIKLDEIELGEAQPVVGLDGLQPRCFNEKPPWNRGTAKFSWDYKDVTYYLTSREELVEFRNNPETYAPKLLGCDPVFCGNRTKPSRAILSSELSSTTNCSSSSPTNDDGSSNPIPRNTSGCNML